MSEIVDEGVLKGNMSIIFNIGSRMILLSLLSIILMVLAGHFSAKISMSFSRDLREGIFTHVLGLSFEQFESFGAPSILNRSTDDINQIERMSIAVLRPLIRAPLILIGASIMAVRTNARLSLIILFVAPLLLIVVTMIASFALPWFKKIRVFLDKVNLVFRERLTGIRVIRAFHREDYEERRFQKSNEDITYAATHVGQIMAYMLPTFNIIFNFSTIAILWFGARQIELGGMEVGDLMAFFQYVSQVMFSVMMFAMMFSMFPNAQASYKRIIEIFNTPLADSEGLTSLPNERAELTFDHVTFRYPGAERPVLSDINFTVKAGEKLAIIGGTGSGKSTILKLINRFYELTEGEIRLNGVPIQKLSLKTLRKALGYVPQKSLLFSRSVTDNVHLGMEGNKSIDTWDILSIAQAKDFIEKMNDQLDSDISQGGKNLSGGQKQRLSIARAIAKNPMIYLFDDSFSALDFETDHKLRKALQPHISDAATIVVAQRVMTVTDSDEILVIDDGKIVSRGTHEELLENSDIYRDIAISQLGEREVNHA